VVRADPDRGSQSPRADGRGGRRPDEDRRPSAGRPLRRADRARRRAPGRHRAGRAPSAGAVTADGETLVLWDGPVLGMHAHPFSPAGPPSPAEPLLQDACGGGGGLIAGAPSAGVAAVASQGRPRGLWVVYRAAGPPAAPRRPRVCDVRFDPRVPGGGVRGRVKLARASPSRCGASTSQCAGPRPAGRAAADGRPPDRLGVPHAERRARRASPPGRALPRRGGGRRRRWSALAPGHGRPAPRVWASRTSHSTLSGGSVTAAENGWPAQPTASASTPPRLPVFVPP
jgi:hypothetical protein